MIDETLFAQVLDPANRADPYRLYARLQEAPVVRQDGAYVVSAYDEIRALLFDPRLRSDVLPTPQHAKTGNPVKDWIINPIKERIIEKHRSVVFRDPPDHAILRRQIMLQFSAERMRGMQARTGAIVDDLLDRLRGRDAFDLVSEFSYPLPITIICQMLGVPAADEQKFQKWASTFAVSLDPDQDQDPAKLQQVMAEYDAVCDYLAALIKTKRRHPKDDVLSGLATFRDKKAGRMGAFDLIANAVLLLIAGHETTVNLISNGMLILLRQPDHLAKLRQEPALAAPMIEEVLRFDPPVQFMRRKALSEIVVAGVRIPKGALVILLLAAGSRDPKRFEERELFNPARKDKQHFGFGMGVHSCIGAPLARIEADAALTALAKRLINPRLAHDPPPYRRSATVRGPQQLMVRIDGVAQGRPHARTAAR
jgi:cytochrome P450